MSSSVLDFISQRKLYKERTALEGSSKRTVLAQDCRVDVAPIRLPKREPGVPQKQTKATASVASRTGASRSRTGSRQSGRFQTTVHGDAWDTEADDLDDTTVTSNLFAEPDARPHPGTREFSLNQDLRTIRDPVHQWSRGLVSQDANEGMLSEGSDRNFDDSGEDGEDYGEGANFDDHTGDISLEAGGASEVALFRETSQERGSSRNTPMRSRQKTTPGTNKSIVASRDVPKVEDGTQLKYGHLSSFDPEPEAPITRAESRKMGPNDLPVDSWRPVGDVSKKRAEHNRGRLGTNSANGGKHLQEAEEANVRIVTPKPEIGPERSGNNNSADVGLQSESKARSQKRPKGMDYNHEQLATMSYQQLKDESFDTNPAAPEAEFPAKLADASLPDKLNHLFSYCDDDADTKREAFFGSLTIDQYEECGDLLIEKFAAVMSKFKTARQRKRKEAQEFEEEIERRQEMIGNKRKRIELDLQAMHQKGRDIVPRNSSQHHNAAE